MVFFIFILNFIFPTVVTADTLNERFLKLELTPQNIFYTPQTDKEKLFYNTGVFTFWRNYGTDVDSLGEFKGYILFADPYHYGMKQISFLLGSDCSNFVHRTLQLLGANYPYAKTRHFIELGKAMGSQSDLITYYRERQKIPPAIDLSECRWQELGERFVLVGRSTLQNAQDGDIVVIAKETGPLGDHGHMGFLVQHTHNILSARNYRLGYTDEIFDPKGQTYYIFRWRASLPLLNSTNLRQLLENTYKPDPSNCPY